MNDLPHNDQLPEMSFQELVDFRNELSTKISNQRKAKSKRLEVYMQPEYMDLITKAKDWAFQNKMIAKDTYWSFAKFALINTANLIMSEINKTTVNQTQSEEYQEHLETVQDNLPAESHPDPTTQQYQTE